MKFSKFFFFIFFSIILNFNLAFCNDKIAFIDLDLIIKNTIIGKKTLTKIENLNSSNIKILKKNDNEIKNNENEIKKKQNIISSEELNKEITLLKKKIKKFNIQKNEMVNTFNMNKNKELKYFFDQVNPIIQSYMNDNSIEILLDRKYVFMGKVNSDLSKKLINEIDKKIN